MSNVFKKNLLQKHILVLLSNLKVDLLDTNRNKPISSQSAALCDVDLSRDIT